MEKEKALSLLNSLIERADQLQHMHRDSPEFDKWKRDARVAVSNIFQGDALHVQDIQSIRYILSISTLETTNSEYQRAYITGLEDAKSTLRSMIDEVNQYWSEPTPKVTPVSATSSNVDTRKIFVVHGRNLSLRDSMFDFLRSIGLQPIEWSQAISETGKSSPSIAEILDAAFSKAQAVVVILSGDDEVKLRDKFIQSRDPPYEKELTPQSRPNVLFESGMAMGRYPDRTILVQFGQHRPWSDVAGKHITFMDNSPQKRNELAIKLSTAGCTIDTSGDSWFSTGDFELI